MPNTVLDSWNTSENKGDRSLLAKITILTDLAFERQGDRQRVNDIIDFVLIYNKK